MSAALHASSEAVGAVRRDLGEHAELVATQAVRLSPRRGSGGKRLAEPGEHRVTLQVAVHVVVALEAVEIEEQQHLTAGWAGTQVGPEIGEQAPAVTEAGELVGNRLPTAAIEDAQVVSEREAGTDHDADQRRQREGDGEVVDTVDVVPGEQRGCHEPARGRDEEERPPFDIDRAARPGPDPGRDAEQ